MSVDRLDFGIFLAPFHPVNENPTLSLQRDFELIEWLDHLGYDEAWIGEHHSAGYEIIASPEVFIAGAAERTRHIRLGTGVSSVPYHHPLMLADRIMQLDHQTRGRVMFGVGPGALPSDAFMMGIDVQRQREMMDEAIAALVPLLRGEPVSIETDWFKLRNAQLQLRPYTKPHVEMAVASQVSPAGARAAGKYGLGLLSIGATTTGGFNALAGNWEICEGKAAEHGQVADRNRWRLVGPMHIAETREKARENVRFGLAAWLDYFRRVAALPLAPEGSIEDAVEAMNATGFAVIGDVEDAIAQLERLQRQSGGFGCFLQMAHDWADREATSKSYELIARYVMPRFQGALDGTARSRDWAAENRPEFIGAAVQAIMSEVSKHAEEQEAKIKKAS
jgi:limonene 1,2-monooxygenase